MKEYCANYNDPVRGIYTLDKAFYENSGGVFENSPHYQTIAEEGD
jgi:hypothetical protein